MVVNARPLTMTVNWVSESNRRETDNSYFHNLVKSSITGLRNLETVYVFTQYQVEAIIAKANFRIAVREMDGLFALQMTFA